MLQNLLGNAWKYSAKVDKAQIEIYQEEIDNRMTYAIKDNGAGFDMKFAARLFEPFKRLHGESEFAGSGIGLATVKSVISKHAGKIWANSAVGRGAIFYFTL